MKKKQKPKANKKEKNIKQNMTKIKLNSAILFLFSTVFYHKKILISFRATLKLG